MKGVKGFIKNSLPEAWEKALRENKCLGSFIEQFYQGVAQPKNKNRYHYVVTIRRAKHLMLHHSLGYIAITLKFKEGIHFWERVNWKAIYYEQTSK